MLFFGLPFFLIVNCNDKLDAIEQNFIVKAGKLTEDGALNCEKISPGKKKLTEEERKCKERNKKSELMEKNKKTYGGSFIF